MRIRILHEADLRMLIFQLKVCYMIWQKLKIWALHGECRSFSRHDHLPTAADQTLATTTDILLCSNLLACFIRRVPGHYWKGGQFFLFFLMLQECCRPTQHPTTDSNVHKSFTALHSKMSGKVSRVPEAAKELLKNRAFYSSRLWRNWDAIEGYMFGEKMIPTYTHRHGSKVPFSSRKPRF